MVRNFWSPRKNNFFFCRIASQFCYLLWINSSLIWSIWNMSWIMLFEKVIMATNCQFETCLESCLVPHIKLNILCFDCILSSYFLTTTTHHLHFIFYDKMTNYLLNLAIIHFLPKLKYISRVIMMFW